MTQVLSELKKKYNNHEDYGILETLKKKTKLLSWITSNCGYTEGSKTRVNIVTKMVESGIKIELRGACFPKNPPAPKKGSKEMQEFLRASKFYLAFENSYHCKDYITEKLYKNGFLAGTVPIVWGASKADYEAVTPPNSCIFVDDFAGNLTRLASYLDYLDRNDTAYREYLQWRTMDADQMYGHGQVIGDCRLCQRLVAGDDDEPSSADESLSIIKSLSSVMYGTEDSECLH